MANNALQMLEQRKTEILENLSGKEPRFRINWWTVALQTLTRAMQKSSQLRDCTLESIVQAMFDIAAMDLWYDGEEAYIIPYGRTAQGQSSYRGKIRRAIEGGAALHISAEVIYEGEPIAPSPPGINGRTLNHTPVLYTGKKPPIVGAYAWGILPHSIMDYVLLRPADIESIKKAAAKGQGLSPAWTNWEEEMVKKSAVNRLCKSLKGDRNTEAGRRFEDMKRAEPYDDGTPPLLAEEMPRAATAAPIVEIVEEQEETRQGAGESDRGATTAAEEPPPSPPTNGGRAAKNATPIDAEQLKVIDMNLKHSHITAEQYRALKKEFKIKDEEELTAESLPLFLKRMHEMAESHAA